MEGKPTPHNKGHVQLIKTDGLLRRQHFFRDSCFQTISMYEHLYSTHKFDPTTTGNFLFLLFFLESMQLKPVDILYLYIINIDLSVHRTPYIKVRSFISLFHNYSLFLSFFFVLFEHSPVLRVHELTNFSAFNYEKCQLTVGVEDNRISYCATCFFHTGAFYYV